MAPPVADEQPEMPFTLDLRHTLPRSSEFTRESVTLDLLQPAALAAR
jgi:hypothetical protein